MGKKALILGCGPAALFAAHACESAGVEPILAGVKRKSEMFGAQYLHAPIPGVSPESTFRVSYEMEGEIQGYKDKVYGPGYRGTVSPEDLMGEHDGWDIRSTYDTLWFRYAHMVKHVRFESPHEIASFIAAIDVAHFISSIPLPLLCSDPTHGFTARKVWSVGDAPERGTFAPITAPLNTVVCSGNRDTSWYRKSNILGFNTVEWPDSRKPPIEGLASVEKPVSTNCTCLPHVHRIGRFGRWEKGVLSHTAFYDTYTGLTGEEWV